MHKLNAKKLDSKQGESYYTISRYDIEPWGIK